MSKITNCKTLTTAMAEVFEKLVTGKIDNKTAIAASHVSDKIIKNVKNQLEYKKLTGKPEKIDFLAE